MVASRPVGELGDEIGTEIGAEIGAIRDAILAGAPGDELAALPLPGSYRGAVVRADEQEMFAGVASED